MPEEKYNLTHEQKEMLFDFCIDVCKSNGKKTNLDVINIYLPMMNVIDNRVTGGVSIPSNFDVITRIDVCIDNAPNKDDEFKIYLSEKDYKDLCALFGVEKINKYKGYLLEII